MRPAFLALPFICLASCDDDDHDHDNGGGGVPIFVEEERNDDPLNANHLGVLRAGDRFFIDGFVRDDLVDPFDGFAFTAGEPLHVDFQLFIGNAAADLDVCLYDPQIDQTVACFATEDDPERGGVDVFAGGLDFHLVIESFVGDATYSLEIAVLPPLAREPLLEQGAPRVRGAEARADHATDAQHDYRKERPKARPIVQIEQRFLIDEERGTVVEIVRVDR